MALASELIGVGVPPAVAGSLGQTLSTGLTAAGTTQATALLLVSSVNKISTAAAATGVRLPPASGQPITTINNGGANDVVVYPATGESINAIAANSGFTLTAAKVCVCIPAGNLWLLTMGA